MEKSRERYVLCSAIHNSCYSSVFSDLFLRLFFLLLRFIIPCHLLQLVLLLLILCLLLSVLFLFFLLFCLIILLGVHIFLLLCHIILFPILLQSPPPSLLHSPPHLHSSSLLPFPLFFLIYFSSNVMFLVRLTIVFFLPHFFLLFSHHLLFLGSG